MEISVSMIGGISIIIGALLVYNGYIYYSIYAYLIGDIVWIILGWRSGEVFGTITILVGVLLGIATWYKMNVGSFVKTLHK